MIRGKFGRYWIPLVILKITSPEKKMPDVSPDPSQVAVFGGVNSAFTTVVAVFTLEVNRMNATNVIARIMCLLFPGYSVKSE